jgi:hypothetical protein
MASTGDARCHAVFAAQAAAKRALAPMVPGGRADIIG